MTSKKVVEKILQNLKKNRNFAPPPVWMASLCAFLILPINFAAAEEVEEDIPETLVSPSEENEGSLDYLVLSDYFITAERIPVHRMETPSTVYLITAEEIEANHYQDLGEALSTVPGVFVSSFDNRATMNGNNRVLILLNGQRLESNPLPGQTIGTNLNIIPSMKMIERIEVVKGGGSALYGSDALGGVINVVTKKGGDNETIIDVNFGSWHRNNYEIANQGTAGKFSWLVTGGIKKSKNADYNGATKNNDFMSLTTAIDEDYILSDYDDNAFSIQFDNKFNDRNSLTALFMHRDHKYAERIDLLQYEGSDEFDSKDKYNTFQISYNFKEGTATPGFLRYFNDHTTNLIGEGRNFSGNGKHRAYGIDYQNGWELGQHKLIFGAEWHEVKASNVNEYDEGYAEHKDKNTAYYIQDTISMGDKWTLVPGVRLDHSSKYKNNWSPKVAANYRADEKTKIFASWGRFYRRPTMADRYYGVRDYFLDFREDLGPWYYKIMMWGSESLKPEKGHTETIGLEHNFDDKTRIGLSLFNTKIKDGIYWTFDDWTDWQDIYSSFYSFMYTGNGNDKQRGFEISFNGELSDKWNIGVAYTYTKTDRTVLNQDSSHIFDYNSYDDSTSDKTPAGANMNPIFITPKNSFNVGINYKCGSWKANLIGKFAGGFGTAGLKNYSVLDFNTSYSFTDWATIYFKVNNLTDKDYTYYAGHHTPGRFLMGGLQFKF